MRQASPGSAPAVTGQDMLPCSLSVRHSHDQGTFGPSLIFDVLPTTCPFLSAVRTRVNTSSQTGCPRCRLPQLLRLLFCLCYHAHQNKSEGTKRAVALHKLSTHLRLRRRQPQLLCLFQKCLLQCLPSLGVAACEDHCTTTERTNGSSPCMSGSPCISNSPCSMAVSSAKRVRYPPCPNQQLSPQSVMHEQSTS